jgi:hypothetical protein
MENLQSVKESFINQLENGLSSIYTKENVIEILEKFVSEISKNVYVNSSEKSYTLTQIKDAIVYQDYDANEFTEIISGSAEFELDYREIVLNSVDLTFLPKNFFDLLEEILNVED